jgi:hypothetical protein
MSMSSTSPARWPSSSAGVDHGEDVTRVASTHHARVLLVPAHQGIAQFVGEVGLDALLRRFVEENLLPQRFGWAVDQHLIQQTALERVVEDFFVVQVGRKEQALQERRSEWPNRQRTSQSTHAVPTDR